MDPNPPVESPAESETRPSLLATMSLVLALVPLALGFQWMLADHLPRWFRMILSITMPVQILVMVVSPIMSIVCGAVALSKMKRDPSLSGRWKALAGIRMTYLAVIVIVLMGTLLFNEPCTSNNKARAGNCIANLKTISTAITIYADDHNQQMPAALEELVNGIYFPLDWKGLKCPASRTTYHYSGASRIW